MKHIGSGYKCNISPSQNKLGSTTECMCAFQLVKEALQLFFFHIHGSFIIVYYSNCSTVFWFLSYRMAHLGIPTAWVVLRQQALGPLADRCVSTPTVGPLQAPGPHSTPVGREIHVVHTTWRHSRASPCCQWWPTWHGWASYHHCDR